MGCIVNGPGEMADADFGYVGGAPGKIDLYVGKEVVRRAIPMAGATDELIELIKVKHASSEVRRSCFVHVAIMQCAATYTFWVVIAVAKLQSTNRLKQGSSTKVTKWLSQKPAL